MKTWKGSQLTQTFASLWREEQLRYLNAQPNFVFSISIFVELHNEVTLEEVKNALKMKRNNKVPDIYRIIAVILRIWN